MSLIPQGPVPAKVLPPRRLDASTTDYAFALRACAWPSVDPAADRSNAITSIQRLWAASQETKSNAPCIPTLSVRTGVDAILSVLSRQFPSGSEVLMSAVTVPDMVKIVQAHGLAPVPVDISLSTLQIRLDCLDKLVTPRTKVLIIAHLFGSIAPIDEVLLWAKQRGIFVIEDAAEAYIGADYRGHADSDAVLFSFGTIKTSTAFGGAIMTIRDPELHGTVSQALRSLPVRPRTEYAKRVAKYMAFAGILNNSTLYASFIRTLRHLGKDHLEVLLANSRGFVAADLFRALRLQPSLPELQVLERRLTTFDSAKLQRRIENGKRATAFLRNIRGIVVPGEDAEFHTYWLFPVVVDNAHSVAASMLEKGYDATSTTSSLCSVDREVTIGPGAHLVPESGRWMMDNILYLPLDGDTTTAEVDQMVLALADIVGQSQAHDFASPGAKPDSNSASKKTNMPQSVVASSGVDSDGISSGNAVVDTPEPSFGALVQGFRDRHEIKAKL